MSAEAAEDAAGAGGETTSQSFLMDNQTSIKFHILPFSLEAKDKPLIFGIFLAIYLTEIFLNLAVIAVICLDAHLHSPMYVFFCNLSSIDICYTTVTVPNLLYILLSGDDLLSVTQCFSQIYFFITCASAEVTLLFVMGYDRLTFNKVVSIKNVFCDIMDIFNASCGGSYEFNIMIYADLVVFGLFPVFCNVLSYVNIVRVIVRIKSKKGRRKTFSTCLFHLIVMTIYYSTGSLVYVMPFSDNMEIMKQILSVFYIIAVPMINPLVYSLRNSEIIKASRKLLKIK
ncbi:olfactory receptor 1G1-like [Engystomops pustulosus]|uniref:olfactory receptor 1G1-like n=1 Tax=Engystomops pustulosus TaxID=76066 RepID=UPI003AFA7437